MIDNDKLKLKMSEILFRKKMKTNRLVLELCIFPLKKQEDTDLTL